MDDIVFTKEFVTPAKAREFLDRSEGNRYLRRHRIDQIKRDILDDEFYANHQAMAFDSRGVFIDGHHRCHGIIEADKGILIYIARNVPTKSKLHVDGNLPRSVRDSIQMIGEDSAPQNTEVAIAKAIELLPDKLTYHYSRHETLKILEQASSSINFAAKFSMRGLSRGTRALFARAHLAGEDEERLEEFFQVIRDGFPVSENAIEDSAGITFRNLLSRLQGNHGTQKEIERYCKGQTCLKAFLSRSQMTKTYGTRDDFFPLPEWWSPVRKEN